MCLECELRYECKKCRYVNNLVDFRTLFNYSVLPEIYHYFLMVLGVSPVTELGHSLIGISAIPFDIGDFPVDKFIGILIRFLNSKNEKFIKAMAKH